MSKRKILGGSLILTIAAAIAVAVVVVGSVAVTPTEAEAGTCFSLNPVAAWGRGTTCAAAYADLNNQADALCGFEFVSCGAGATVSYTTGCYYSYYYQYIVDGNISNSCTVSLPPGGIFK